MATKIVHGHTCDDCEDAHLYDVVAEQHYVIAINDGPYKRFDFCSPSERAVMGRILQLYRKGGEELEKTQETPHGAELPAIPEGARATEDTPPAPAAKKRRTGKATKALTAPAQEPLPSDQPAAKPRQYVWCPEPHPSKKGAGTRVPYGDRNSHADMCHDHARLWDIEWGDPDGIIKVHCTAHAECVKRNIGFTTEVGLGAHIRATTLPRIDGGASQTIDEAAREQPGGS